jgi:hypothetical protein
MPSILVNRQRHSDGWGASMLQPRRIVQPRLRGEHPGDLGVERGHGDLLASHDGLLKGTHEGVEHELHRRGGVRVRLEERGLSVKRRGVFEVLAQATQRADLFRRSRRDRDRESSDQRRGHATRGSPRRRRRELGAAPPHGKNRRVLEEAPPRHRFTTIAPGGSDADVDPRHPALRTSSARARRAAARPDGLRDARETRIDRPEARRVNGAARAWSAAQEVRRRRTSAARPSSAPTIGREVPPRLRSGALDIEHPPMSAPLLVEGV